MEAQSAVLIYKDQTGKITVVTDFIDTAEYVMLVDHAKALVEGNGTMMGSAEYSPLIQDALAKLMQEDGQ